MQDIPSAVYYATRCDRIVFERGHFSGYVGTICMMALQINVVSRMIKDGLLTPLYKRDIKELEIQLALGTFCNMLNIDGTPLILIPTSISYAMYIESKAGEAYRCTACKQINFGVIV